jgi:hypothetical protein
MLTLPHHTTSLLQDCLKELSLISEMQPKFRNWDKPEQNCLTDTPLLHELRNMRTIGMFTRSMCKITGMMVYYADFLFLKEMQIEMLADCFILRKKFDGTFQHAM